LHSTIGRVFGPLFLGVAVWAGAEEPLDVARYVVIVTRANPAGAHALALQDSARAESKASRQIPDPVFEYSRGRASSRGELPMRQGTETGYSISQTVPWSPSVTSPRSGKGRCCGSASPPRTGEARP
jgi:hypothetical protein